MPNRKAKNPQGHRKKKPAKKVSTAVTIPGAPKSPAKLGVVARKVWASYWASDISQLTDRPDHYALKRWIEAVDERERLHRAVKKATTVKGSTGQPVLNPLAKRLESLEGQIERFERQFGMTPKARADLGISVGQAAMTAEQLNRMTEEDDDQDDEGEEAIDGEFVEA